MRHTNKQKAKQALRERRHKRVRARICGTAERPRLSIFRSLRSMTAQVINDEKGHTMAAAAARELSAAQLKAPVEGKDGVTYAGKIAQAYQVGVLLGERAKAAGITSVVFDKGPYKYHGRVRALAVGARSAGLSF